jgi:hypothetical protein
VSVQLCDSMRTDAGMARFLDGLFGSGNYAYDRFEDVWVAPDRSYHGPGRGFLVVRRGGDWFATVLPASAIS